MSDQRFNTGNPIGSDSPLDRSDNTRNFDVLENSRELTEFPDRFGVPRKTRYGREVEFDASQQDMADRFNSFLSASGYQPLGEYAPGIEITAHNQYVEYAGQPYLLKPSVPVPYTTSGGWDGEDFVLIGDNALRQDLANPGMGASMVGVTDPVRGETTTQQVLDDLRSSQYDPASVRNSRAEFQELVAIEPSVNLDKRVDANGLVDLTVSRQNLVSNSRGEFHQAAEKTNGVVLRSTEFTTIDGIEFSQVKISPPGAGLGNGHTQVGMSGCMYPSVTRCSFDGELGMTFGFGPTDMLDRRTMHGLAAFNVGTDIWGMFIENLGASYTRIIGNALDSATRGVSIGIRVAGYDKVENPNEATHAPCHGIVGAGNVLRNITYGVSLQNSSKLANLGSMHLSSMVAAVSSTPGTVAGNYPSLHRLDFTASGVEKAFINSGVNHSRIGFHVDGKGFANNLAGWGAYGVEELSGYTGKGFNHYDGLIKDAGTTAFIGRFSHTLFNLQVSGSPTGTGVFVNGSYGNGSITVDGAQSNGVTMNGSFNSLSVVATACGANGVVVGGSNNALRVITDSGATITGSNNEISGNFDRITATGTGNKFSGFVSGTISKGVGNDFTGIKGFSGTVAVTGQSTNADGHITVTVPKHASAEIAVVTAIVPGSTLIDRVIVRSVSGAEVTLEFIGSSGSPVANTVINFRYFYSCI